MEYTACLSAARRLVVKVGTSILTHADGRIDTEHMSQLVAELASVADTGRDIILVTSGAVGAGMGRLGLTCRPQTLPEKQAVAAVGQGVLMRLYEQLFEQYGRVVGQILLTRQDVEDRTRYLNARHTFLTLLDFRVLPIVNENDTVAVEEIRFGDNDTLAALVAGLADADLVVILTDTGGLYNADPKVDSRAQLIPLVEEITPEIEGLAGRPGSSLATGGMATKVAAAKIAQAAGIPLVVASGREKGVLMALAQGLPRGTFFAARGRALPARKHWIAFAQPVRGQIWVDAGAARAVLLYGKSLLPSGVGGVRGTFAPGQVVSVIGPAGQEIARGMVNYGSAEVERLKGRQSHEIEAVLGYKDYDEIIHRDNLVLQRDLGAREQAPG
ncbi:MAG: glutamate 5-kinase [Clostridia bacterium]|nr:MAG: glutamate 5-kinase [Clostridia bacterium]